MIYRPLILAQKQQGGFMVLTEGLGRWSCSAGERTAMSRGGAAEL